MDLMRVEWMAIKLSDLVDMGSAKRECGCSPVVAIGHQRIGQGMGTARGHAGIGEE